MKKLSKESIIATYNDLVQEQGSIPMGEGVFTRETGISTYYWKGGFWRSWSAFQTEAGHAPNSPTQRIADETVLQRFAEIAAERGALLMQNVRKV